MKRILSCDWGTSALRLRLVDAGDVIVLAEAANRQGISNTFELWKKTGKPEEERITFYQTVLSGQIKSIEQQLKISLDGIPVIISGMASSNMGMIELPYKEIPFHLDLPELNVKETDATNEFRHAMLIVSGVRTTDDVMRGEETQLIGCVNELSKEKQLLIFPGTHSKHVTVKNGIVSDIKTYMTGEFFELLSVKSILSGSVKESLHLADPDNLKSFEKGVSDSQNENLLHSSFLVRTNDLFGKLSKEKNYYYLSGLLTGYELKETMNHKMLLTVVSNKSQMSLYEVALNNLGISGVKYDDADNAIVKGHCKLYDFRMQVPDKGLK
jgi:2-dehydro-3-deoxygalactonokinase